MFNFWHGKKRVNNGLAVASDISKYVDNIVIDREANQFFNMSINIINEEIEIASNRGEHFIYLSSFLYEEKDTYKWIVARILFNEIEGYSNEIAHKTNELLMDELDKKGYRVEKYQDQHPYCYIYF